LLNSAELWFRFLKTWFLMFVTCFEQYCCERISNWL
jgi:hypothetical protein